MKSERIALRGGQLVVDGAVSQADLVVAGGKVEQVISRDTPIENAEEIDVSGQYVIPGLVDPHCHFNTFSHHADDLETLSTAALAGGVTTIIPFLIPGGRKGQPGLLTEILEHFIDLGQRRSLVDFSYHIALWPKWDAIEEIERCVELGCSSFKMFMALPRLGRMVPDDLLVAMMIKISEAGSLAMTHAENGLVTDYLERKQIERGEIDPTMLGSSRPPEMEEEATFRASCLARVAGSDLYVVHVTCGAALESIRRVQERGWRVAAETCPQYLTLNDEEMKAQGALAKVAPPLRTRDDQEALWAGVRSGGVSFIGSDHSAHERAVKEKGNTNVFGEVPFGAATVETMLPVLFSEGVHKNQFSIERLVELTSRNPARTFGLFPRKGTLQPGADADIVVIDPLGKHTVEAANHKDRSGYSLYEGWDLNGAVTSVFRAGRLAVKDGVVLDHESRGRYIARAASRIAEGLV